MSTTPIHPLSYSLPDAWDSSIDGWVAWLTAAGHSAATRRTRRAHVRSVARELGAASPRDVSGDDLLAIQARPSHSIEHRRALRSSLSSFYRWCVTSGVVTDDPTAALPVVRPAIAAPRPATDEIWQQILATADPRTRLMARLAGEAGLRRAEVAQVHTNDLNEGIDGAELIVHGKGGKQRVVPITAALAAEIGNACPSGGFLFPGRIDGHMAPECVGRLVSRMMPKGWSMHKLRHRFATRGYAGTGNLRAVQEALGHASVATTQIYTAVSSTDVRRVSEAASGPVEHVVKAPEKAPPTETAFGSVVSTLHDVPRCEVTALKTWTGAPCRRAAKWRVDLHGCLQIVMCERDLREWKRSQLAGLFAGRVLECVHCGKISTRLDELCSITQL